MTGSGLPSTGSVHGAYYTYLTNSDLLANLEFKRDATVLAKTIHTYEDNRDLITNLTHRWRPNGSNDLISGYAYISDDLARRSSVVNTGVAFGGTGNEHLSLWSYNDRNELTGSARYADDDPEDPENPVDAEQFAYAYDPIGNRTAYDVGDPPTTETDYVTNALNQYLRAETDAAVAAAQGYRHDADGNLIEAFVAADMNCDGTIDSFDIDPFVLAMTNLYGQGGYYEQYPTCNHLNGDLNGDGAVDSFDLDLFTALLTGSAGATGLRVEYTWNAENP